MRECVGEREGGQVCSMKLYIILHILYSFGAATVKCGNGWMPFVMRMDLEAIIKCRFCGALNVVRT